MSGCVVKGTCYDAWWDTYSIEVGTKEINHSYIFTYWVSPFMEQNYGENFTLFISNYHYWYVQVACLFIILTVTIFNIVVDFIVIIWAHAHFLPGCFFMQIALWNDECWLDWRWTVTGKIFSEHYSHQLYITATRYFISNLRMGSHIVGCDFRSVTFLLLVNQNYDNPAISVFDSFYHVIKSWL